MKYKISEIIDFIENWAKPEYMMDWDNSGKQIYFDRCIEKVLVSMDVDNLIVDKAVKENIGLIVTHHPLFFTGLKSISEGEYKSDLILKLLENKISVFSAHTTLDVAKNGVNDILAEKLQIINTKDLAECENSYYIGKIGYIKEMNLISFLDKMKKSLCISDIKLMGKKKEVVSKIALCGGSGSDFIPQAIREKADVFITGDLKYHDAQYAYENNLMLIDIGHFQSEKFILEEIKLQLLDSFINLSIEVHDNTNFYFKVENI